MGGLACTHDRSFGLQVEGPIPGGETPGCDVLRCGSRGVYLATLRFPVFGGSTTQRLLCAEHAAAVRAGEPWRWDDDETVFLMGPDRDRPGELVVSRFELETRDLEVDSELGSAPVHVVLDTATASGAKVQQLHVQLSRETAAELGTRLIQFARIEEQ